MFNFIAIAYFFTSVPLAFTSLYLMLLTISGDVIIFFLDAIFKLLIFAFGYTSCYIHNNKFSCYAVGVGGIDLILCKFINVHLSILNSFAYTLLITNIILCLLTLRLNKIYNYLEQQEGFPYFNERVEDQKAMQDRDIYLERYNEIKKASSGKSDMDDL